MKWHLAALLASTWLLTACAPQASQQTQTGQEGIRHGRPANAGELIARSTVAVVAGQLEGVCSGTILSKNLVVTAAHCIQEGMNISLVFDVNITNAKAYRSAAAVIVHENFISELANPLTDGPHLNRADIALVYFMGGLPAGYEPATILADDSVKAGMTAVVAGYGVYDDSPTVILPQHLASDLVGTGTGLLRSANVTVAQPNFSESEALLDQSLGAGACQGDSGGPAYKKVGDKLHVWGVASWGRVRSPKGSCLEYAVYTRLDAFKDWIQAVQAAIKKAESKN